METARRKLITILAPENAEFPIAEDLRSLGVPGYTAVPASGQGQHGIRPSTWHGRNVQIEVIVDASLVTPILEALELKHRHAHPCVAWVTDIEAWPAEKF
ncbi:MAG: hypothetical protein U0271_16845 [Polyangiaceae bacterium]